MRAGKLIALVAVLLAGCFEQPRPNCAFMCGANAECPADYSCGTDGRCHLILASGELAVCEDSFPDAAAPDAPVTPDAPQTFDAEQIDADPTPDAEPPPSYAGTIALTEASVNGHPELGSGLKLLIDFSQPGEAPVFDTSGGGLVGCWAWDTEIGVDPVPAQENAGAIDVALTGAAATVPTCTFIPGAGYMCIGGQGSAEGAVIAAGAAPGLWTFTIAGNTFAPEQVGRYISLSDGDPGNTEAWEGAYPILARPADDTLLVAGGLSATTLPAGATWTTVAGVGPIPPVPAPTDWIPDDTTVSVSWAGDASTGYEQTTVNVTGGVGSAFVLSDALTEDLTTIPVTGGFTSADDNLTVFHCDSDTTEPDTEPDVPDCTPASGTIVVLDTTDTAIPVGAPDYYMPAPTSRAIRIQCRAFTTADVVIPYQALNLLADAGVTRVQATVMRIDFGLSNQEDMRHAVSIAAGHSQTFFTTPAAP